MNGDRFQPLVLCYHAVSDSWPDRLTVGPEMLERQLRSLLRRRYRPAGADSVLGGSGKLLHVTFDDAYRSVAKAMPVLERLRVPATVFACTSFADDGRVLDVPELALEAAKYPDELATMSWDELESLVERGIEVGSHTVTHAHLTRLSDADLKKELQESRERLEARLGRPCRYLAYPYGEEDARVRASARAAGYVAAFGLPGSEKPVDRYSVPRIGVWRSDNLLRFTIKTVTLTRRLARAAPWLIPRGKQRVPPAPAAGAPP